MDNVSADFTIQENQPLQAEYTLGESEHFDCSFELFATGTAWGLITGNLEDQTDLWDVLSSKADTETVEQNLSAIEGEISDLSDTVDNNYTTLVNRLENDELAISNNSDEIDSLSNTIQSYGDIVTYDASYFATSAQGALADTALQSGDNISELVNNVGYITSASLPTLEDLTTQAQLDAINSGATTSKINQIASNTQAISTETENRQTADNNLQSQIDAITASSDVTDIVGTYAQLQAYDTSTLPPNSIIKVLQDEHQNNETTYYRWVITGGVGAWVLIGEEGPYYTKSEADGRFVPQTRTINSKALSNNISLDASDVGALPSSTVIPTVNNGTLDIQVNGTSVGTFTANQSGNTTANIIVPDSATWGNITGDITDQTDLQDALDDKQDVLTAGTGINITNNVISNTQTSAEWGNITGDIEDQTDLQNALNDKQDVLTAGTDLEIISAESARLPQGYTEVEYIQSDGDCYIDTGIISNGTDTIEQKFQKTGTLDTTCSWFGSMEGNILLRFSIGSYYKSSASKSVFMGGYNFTQQLGDMDTNAHVVKFYCIGNTYYDEFDGLLATYQPTNEGSNPTINSWLFARHGADGVNTIYDNEGTRIFYHKQKRFNGTVILDLVPARRNSDDELGFYNLANNTFLTNSGTGTLTAGADVVFPDTTVINFTNDSGYITGINSTDVTDALGYTPVNPSSLATVATTGSYNDLADKPYIPSGVIVDQTFDPTSQNAQSGVAINGAGFLTGITSSDVTTALGYIPYNSSNPNGYTSNVGTVTSVNNVQPVNGNVTITIPTVPTNVSAFTNDAGYITSSALSGYVPVSANSQIISATSGDFTINTYYSLIVNDTINDIEPIRYDSTSQQLQLFNSDSYPVVAYFEANIPNNNLILNVEGDFNIDTIDSGADVYINSSKVLTTSNVDQTYDSTSTNPQSGVAIANAGFLTGITSGDVTTALGYTPYNSSNPSGYITSSDLPTNHVTTDTDQNITGIKTFVGQKRIAFKQSASGDKLGFTLYNNSGTEKGYLEYNPSNTVDSVPLMTLGNYATASAGLAHVGFRKYSNISGANGAYNLLAPLISDAKTPFSLTTTYTNFYLPLGFTDGNSTVKTAKSGLVDLSSILPTVNNSTITFTQGGVTKGSITLNQASNSTIALDAGGSGGIQNTATGTDSLTILGTATTNDYSMNIGPYSSVTEDDSIAIGQGASVSGADSLGIGRDCNVAGDNSIQLGNGTLIDNDTFQVWNYPLLDYQYGEIFEVRIPSTIARTSQIANMQTTGNLVTSISSSSTDSQYPSAKCVYDIIGDIETLLQAV